MKNFLSTFFLLCAINCNAQTTHYTSDTYEYSILNGESISLHKYLGDEESFSIPTTFVHEGETYPVTELSGPTGKSIIPSDLDVKDIIVPSSITRLALVTRENKNIETVTIENGNNLTYVQSGFYFDTNSSNFKYIIVFHNNNTYFTSMNGGSYLYHDCKIDLKYFDNSITNETIRMYFLSKVFDDTKLEHFISALNKRGTDIGSISEVKISNNSNNALSKMDFNLSQTAANKLAFGAKLFVSSSTKYTVSTNIPDKVNFTAPSSDITAKITYSRDNTQNWNSVCLPFDIKESIFGNDVCKIYTVSSATATEINLTRVEDEETVIPAGTPCFINSSAEEWDLSLSNVTISSNVIPITINVDNNWQVIGSFTTQTIGAGKYKLNGDGDAFGITTSDAATVMPFRCYIATTSSNTPARLNVNIDEEASITLIPNDAAPQRVKFYDLMGRPQKEGAKGLFIKSTR